MFNFFSLFLGNSPSIPDMSTLSAKSSRHGGLAKTAKFMVKIFPDSFFNMLLYGAKLEDLSFFCEAAELPGRGLQSTQIQYYGPAFKSPFQTSFEDLNLTFLVRENFIERNIFDTWMELINPNYNYDFFYRDDYCATIKIFPMSDVAGRGANYTFTFKKAWPILVNPQPVTWADDNFHRVTVSFTYRNWTRGGFDEFMPNGSGYRLAPSESNNLDRMK